MSRNKFKKYLHVTPMETGSAVTYRTTQLLHNSSYGKVIDARINYDSAPSSLQDLIIKSGVLCHSPSMFNIAKDLHKEHGKPIISYRMNEDGTFTEGTRRDAMYFFLPGVYEIIYSAKRVDDFIY